MRDFLTCSVCGNQITGSNSKGRTKKYAYYHCRNKCKTRVSVDDTHLKIASILGGLQINENIKELFSHVLKDSEYQINKDKISQLKVKIETQKDLKTLLENAEDRLLREDIDKETFNHFSQLRELLNHEQVQTFDNTIQEVLRTMGREGRPDRPPPPHRNGMPGEPPPGEGPPPHDP